MRPSFSACDEGVVVALVLVGVGLGELDEGPVEGVAAAEVGGDGDAVAGAGVGPGQASSRTCGRRGHGVRGSSSRRRRRPSSPAAGGRRSRGRRRRSPRRGPSRGRCRCWLAIRCWPCTTRSPWDGAALGPTNSSSTDGLGLLGLQEQRVGVVTTEHQHDPRPSADAADTDDLAGHVGQAEVLEQVAAVALQRAAGSVRITAAAKSMIWSRSIPWNELLDRLDERRVADDASLPVHDVGQLVEGLQCCRGCGPWPRWPRPACGRPCPTRPRSSLSAVSTSMWAYHTARLVIAANWCMSDSVLAEQCEQHLRAFLGREAVVAAGDGEAGGEPLDVPLPRARGRSRRSR